MSTLGLRKKHALSWRKEISKNKVLYFLVLIPLAMILGLLVHYLPSRGFRKTVQMVSCAPHFLWYSIQ